MKLQNVTLPIEKINADGKGSGFFTDLSGNEKEAEVSFTMPGDLVEVSVHRKKRGVFPAKLIQLIAPSQHRIAPKCIHFGICGGCSFQHIPYSMQLKNKENRVKDLFSGLLQPLSIIGCNNPFGYRNKMEFSFSENKEGDRFLGLFMSGMRGRVFNVKKCELVSPWFNESLEKAYAWWETSGLRAYYPPKDFGHLRTLTLRESATTGEKMAMLTVSGNPLFAIHQSEIDSFSALFDDKTSVFIRIHQSIKGKATEFFELHLKGPEFISETFDNVDFQVSPSAFFQPNTKQAEILYQTALKLADLSKEDVLYDLYCGTGTIGLIASGFVKKVIGIELSYEASLDARENAKRNRIENIEVFTGSVGDVLQKKGSYEPPSVVILDPPRSGLDPCSLKEVIALNSPKIIYISCNPATQSRDVKVFLEAGYQLKVLQPVDQFPNTPHIENIAVLYLSDMFQKN